MARSFSNAKLLSALVADNISLAINRRGYAAASQGVVASGARGGGARSGAMARKQGEEKVGSTSAWVPDPVTGYYRPENHADEIDVAELRNMLLKHRIRQH